MIRIRLAVGLLLLSLSSLWASWGGEPLERILAGEHQRATTGLEQATAAQRKVKAEVAEPLTLLDGELAAVRTRLDELRSSLISVLAGDDAAAMKSVQAEIAAQQARGDAAEAERALLLKRNEEAGREVEAWKTRLATLDLALRMEMKVLLATPADLDSREKKVENARKDVEYQASQVRKYKSRRDTAAAKCGDLSARLARLAAERRRSGGERLSQALADEARQVERARRTQEDWVLFNRVLEERARRGLAFAHLDVQVNVGYAAELGWKDAQRRADDAKTLADQAGADLAAARAALEPRAAAVANELTAAGREATAALAAIGRTQDAREQEAARAAYEAAQENRNRWEAEGEFLKEFIALQKAVSAFAEEKAERARSAAEKKSLRELEQELRALEESAGTSVQYVQSFKTLLQKLDGQIDAARKGLGLTPEQAAPFSSPIEEWAPTLARERVATPNILLGRLAVMSEKLADESGADTGVHARRVPSVAAQFVHRVGQRSLARQRLEIAELWLEGTRNAMVVINQKISNLYWEQRDPRLSWASVHEIGGLFSAVASDAGFAWAAVRLGLVARAGYATVWRGVGSLVLVLCLAVAAVLAFARLQALQSAFGWFGAQVAVTVPPLAAGYLLAFTLMPGNRLARLTGLALLVGSGWWAVRAALVARTAGHRFPGLTTVGGAALAALRLILSTGAAALVLTLLAQAEEGHWNVQRFLLQVWLLVTFLAAFRFVLHPTLLGHFLSRRSAHVGMRLLGACVAYACIIAAGLATSLFLLALDNLGQTVLRTVLSSFGLLALAVVGSAVLSWLLRRTTSGTKWTAVAWERLAQGAMGVLVAGLIGWAWSQLLNGVLFSANAPEALQHIVRAGADVAHRLLQLWQRQLTGGMTVSSFCRGLTVFVLSFWVSKVAKRLFLERVLARTPMDETTRLTFATVLGYLVIVFGFLIGLNVAGSSLQNLALLAGAITVGLGFGLQNVINNFVSSLLIHFGRTIRVGDYIDVGGQRGTVREIGLRNTVIFTDDGVTVLVPNGSFITANIVNWTNPNRLTRAHVPVTVVRQADLSEVTQILTDTALAHPDIVRKPLPAVEIRTAAADKISVELLAWTEKPERLVTIVGELTLEADRRLRDRRLVV